ncbi:MAG: glycosyltransferase family 39 protein, partial [Bacteroidales bacterium]|nr:glycosyltransferase family 39 protein [Bacteroidales bacterium]
MKNTIFDRYHFLHKYFRMFANFINKIRYEPGLVIFLVSWFIINLIQSAFTGIFNDEAYYWMYSENLDWGYFDHPPMIALLIKIGYLIFPNQLGVRFITVVLSTLTLYFIYKLIDHEKKSVKWFIIITTSIILVHSHVCGFIAIPDSPLIFFTVIFFHLYKKFIQNESYTNTILLAIVIALMLYSKYHSVLVLFFTILSNWKIILKTRFWLIAIVSLALFSPHIYWQIVNDFPSLKYHLSERLDAYTIKHTINFIYSQILVAGPLIGVILIFFAFKYKPKNRLENALKFTLIGFYLFFFLSSFKGHTEAHWTAIAIIPLVILAFQEILDKPKILKWCQ